MGKAISYAVREKIVARRQQGEKYSEIAMAFNCSESGVKKIWYAYQKTGESALKTNYHNCGGHSIYGSDIKELVKEIRDNQQGSYYVHSKLELKRPKEDLPSARTINRWWKKEGSSRKVGRPSSSEKKTGQSNLTKPGK